MTYVPTARPPTGIPSAPLIMVSGAAKSGKSMTAYKLGLSPRIDQCWVCDLGEGSADEYGDLGGYTVLNWGTSWSDLADTIKWCVAQPAGEGLMNAVIIDSGSEMWQALKDRASARAAGSQKNKRALAADPDAEIDVSMNYWNDAANTWGKIVGPLKLAGNLVGVILVRADEVNEVANGAPTSRKVISLQAHKSLPAIVTAHVQVRADHTAHLVEVRSAKVSVPPRGVALGANPLGEVLDLLAPVGGFAAPVVNVPVDDERAQEADPSNVAANAILDRIKALHPADLEDFKQRAPGLFAERITEATLTGSAPLRASVTAVVDSYASTAAEPSAPVQQELVA